MGKLGFFRVTDRFTFVLINKEVRENNVIRIEKRKFYTDLRNPSCDSNSMEQSPWSIIRWIIGLLFIFKERTGQMVTMIMIMICSTGIIYATISSHMWHAQDK
jgi:hypothetical protein